MKNKIRIAAFLSGGGTTLQNLIDLNERGELPVQIDLVLSSKADAYGLSRARKHGIETAVVASKDFRQGGRTDWAAMSGRINQIVLPRQLDLVCLCGFMCFYVIPPQLTGRIINIHPSLIPAFCGQGMCGHHVHEAVVATGVKISGCTVHFVTAEYDAGPIILQRTCPVYDTDTADDVAERVFKEECIAYPEAVRLFAENRLRIEGNIVRVAPPAQE